jgi:hypothetical protein
MKALFFVLLLANVVLALYVQVAEHRRPALDLAAVQLHPEKMRIVTGAPPQESATPAPATTPETQPETTPPVITPPPQTAPAAEPHGQPAAPQPQSSTPPATTPSASRTVPPADSDPASQVVAHPVASATARPAVVCATLSGIAGADADRVEATLTQLAAGGHVTRRTAEADRYWVYIPPRSGDVDAAVDKLRADGVTDYFVVQDHTHWRNAISLGLFRTDDAAKAFLADLRRKGVIDATMTVRHDLGRQVVFAIDALPAQLLLKVDALRRNFPDSRLSSGACPPARAG